MTEKVKLFIEIMHTEISFKNYKNMSKNFKEKIEWGSINMKEISDAIILLNKKRDENPKW